MEEGLVAPHESPHPTASCKSCAKTDFSMQPALVAALETHMEILIELIAGAVFVLVFLAQKFGANTVTALKSTTAGSL
jgi:hypothetical protein